MRLLEHFPHHGLPELPVLKESLFSVYATLLEQLHSFFEILVQLDDEIVQSDIMYEFLKENATDRVYQAKCDHVISSENYDDLHHAASALGDKRPGVKKPFVKYRGTPQSLNAHIVGLHKLGAGSNRHYVSYPTHKKQKQINKLTPTNLLFLMPL